MRRKAPRAIFDEIEHEIKDSILLCALKIAMYYPNSFVKYSEYGIDETLAALFRSIGLKSDLGDLEKSEVRAQFFEEARVAYERVVADGIVSFPNPNTL